MAEEPAVSLEAHGSYIAQATSGGTATIQVYASPPTLADQNRQRFLVRLRTRYRDLLEHSLHGAVRLTLELAGHPEAVSPPVRLLYQPEQQPVRPLPTGTSLSQVYADAGQELLVLGEPGAGKSTLLLELAFDLVQQAERDHSLLLPVIVPLSSWANQRQPLEQWLAGQIALLYDIALPLSERWVREERLLPLLDGLDEMEEEARVACIAAINAYHREHLHPLVVASRKAEYEAAATHARLVLHSAVVVQPLTNEQVDAYLVQSGEAVAALRTVLRENPMLQELATTPLLLSILLLIYQGKAVSDLPTTDSLPEHQRQLFAHYVERMVERKETLTRSSPQELVSWLSWLARQMHGHNQTVFYLEHLQPNSLTSAQQRWYSWWAVRLPAVLIGMLASLTVSALFAFTDPASLLQYAALGGLLGWLFSGSASVRAMPPHQTREPHNQGRIHLLRTYLLLSTIFGLVVGLSFGWGDRYWLRDGLIHGVVIGLANLLLSLLLLSRSSERTSPSMTDGRVQGWKSLIRFPQTKLGQRTLYTMLSVGIGFGLSDGLSSGLSDGLSSGLSAGLSSGLSAGLLFGLISLLVSLTLQVQTRDIVLTEHLQWTWTGLMKSLFASRHVKTVFLIVSVTIVTIGLGTGLSGGLIAGLGSGLSFGLIYGLGVGLSFGLSLGFLSGLLYWILLGLFQGVASERIEDRLRRVPNQGIRSSWRNSLSMAFISDVIITVLGALSSGLISGYNFRLSSESPYELHFGLGGLSNIVLYGLSSGWLAGMCGGLLVCSVSGGLAVLRHYVIRLLLARSHAFPWHAPRFLEEATARILLRRVGGGYSFPHRLLLDYFADLPKETP